MSINICMHTCSAAGAGGAAHTQLHTAPEGPRKQQLRTFYSLIHTVVMLQLLSLGFSIELNGK